MQKKEDYLTEGMIRAAIEETQSCKRAAEYLGVRPKTFKKYAEKHFTTSEGEIITLYEFMLQKSKANEHKRNKDIANNHERVIKGLAKPVTVATLERRLVEHGTFPMCCSECGYDYVRPDGKMPLKVDFVDGDKTNQLKENLRWLCYNCFFIEGR